MLLSTDSERDRHSTGSALPAVPAGHRGQVRSPCPLVDGSTPTERSPRIRSRESVGVERPTFGSRGLLRSRSSARSRTAHIEICLPSHGGFERGELLEQRNLLVSNRGLKPIIGFEEAESGSANRDAEPLSRLPSKAGTCRRGCREHDGRRPGIGLSVTRLK